MGVLGSVVQPLVAPMHGVGEQLCARRAVTGELVRHHDAGRILHTPQQFLEESSGSPLVAMGLHQDIEDAAVRINGTPQILQSTTELDEHLVQMPGIAQLSASGAVPSIQCIVQQRVPQGLASSNSKCNFD